MRNRPSEKIEKKIVTPRCYTVIAGEPDVVRSLVLELDRYHPSHTSTSRPLVSLPITSHARPDDVTV